MTTGAPFLRAILPSLPSDLATKIRKLCGSASDPAVEDDLDTLIRFITGAECMSQASADTQEQWAEKQQAAIKIIHSLTNRPGLDEKRPREGDSGIEDNQAKRQRLSAENDSALQNIPDQPIFTIHTVLATSPVRKKVDITIHQTLLALSHPVTHTIEATAPLANLKRVFIVPTRGKIKAHWTVILLTSDTPPREKPRNNGPTASSTNQQIIFGIDAVASTPLSFTKHADASTSPTIVPKGSQTRPFILDFLNCLNVPIFEPTPDVFKSACTGMTSGVSANEDGIPGVEAYRGTKVGSLWFMKEGILWGEGKFCEFWSLESLISKSEGVRIVGGTGRTCTVVLTRKSGDVVGEDEQDIGIENEFSMVDSREKSAIDGWVRTFRNLFGKKVVPVENNHTTRRIDDDSDEEDEIFEADSDEEHDGSTSLSGSSSGEETGESDEESAEEIDLDADGEDELNEEHHPLLRPGAMPRMNRAVVDMVVGMVEDDMMGKSNMPASQSDEEEEDELDD